MPRIKAASPRTDPKQVEKVLARHRCSSHLYSHGATRDPFGVSCFVWVSGICYSENSLSLSGSVEQELRALPHAYNVHINID